MRRQWISGVVFLSLCLAVMVLGATTATPALAEWYPQLRKPSWTPPAWVFGPVWTLLYLSMALAAWRVWCQRHTVPVTWPLGCFAIQLALNAAWSPAFFGLRQPLMACGIIVALWGSILATIVAFWRVRPWFGWLLTPYLSWVTYATGLNAAIWWLNR